MLAKATAEEKLMVTCFACGKKLRVSNRQGQMAYCPHCHDRFVIAPDDDPRRQVEVWFSQHHRYAEKTIDRIKTFIEASKTSLDIAMFALTHDWLKVSFEKAVKNGVKVRILLEREQALTRSGEVKRGSDHEEYLRLGIAISLDVESGLMHHKFAIRDGKAVLTGSYNWSKAAQVSNQENFLIIWHSHVVSAYAEEFEKLWEENKKGILSLDHLG